MIDRINNLIKENTILISVLFLSFAIRGVLLTITDNHFYGGDIFARVHIAYNMIHSGNWFSGLDWPPGHLWLLNLMIQITGDTFFAPRIPGFICDSLSSGFIFLIVQKILNTKAAIFSSVLHATHYPFIIFSTVTLSGPINSFLILAGTYFFLVYQDKKILKYLVASACFFAYANWIRHESWIVSFLFGVYLIFIHRNFKHIFSYGLITVLPILMFSLVNYIGAGDVLHFLRYSDQEVRGAFALNPQELYDWTRRVLVAFPFSTLFLGVTGSILFIWKSKFRFYTLIYLTLFTALTAKLLDHSLINDPRYFILVSIWLICMATTWIYYFVPKKFQASAYICWFLFIITAQFPSIQYFKATEIKNSPLSFRFADLETIKFLAQTRDPLDRFYFDLGLNFTHKAIFYNAKLHPDQYVCEAPNRFWLGYVFEKDKFFHCIEQNNVNMIVALKRDSYFGAAHKFLKTTDGQKFLNENKFVEVFKVDDNIVYKRQ